MYVFVVTLFRLWFASSAGESLYQLIWYSSTKGSKGGNPDQNSMPKNAARNLSFVQTGFADQEGNHPWLTLVDSEDNVFKSAPNMFK